MFRISLSLRFLNIANRVFELHGTTKLLYSLGSKLLGSSKNLRAFNSFSVMLAPP